MRKLLVRIDFGKPLLLPAQTAYGVASSMTKQGKTVQIKYPARGPWRLFNKPRGMAQIIGILKQNQ